MHIGILITSIGNFGKKGFYNMQEIGLAKELDNEILLAHVYRYSHFFNCSRQNKQECLQKAENIFMKYKIFHFYLCQNIF